jgi:hypothetical protein
MYPTTYNVHKCSDECTKKLMKEACRVLKPGGLLLSFSLHSWESIHDHYSTEDLNWTVMPYHIPNARWNEEENVERSVVHTMVVCVKHGGVHGKAVGGGGGGGAEQPLEMYDIPGTLCEEEVKAKKAHANEVRHLSSYTIHHNIYYSSISLLQELLK